MRKTSLEVVTELARKDDRIVFIGSDLGAGTMKEFRQEFPDRFFMEGISEANVVGMAAGMAMDGKIPYINTIATFLSRRCFEQIVLDLALHKQKVRLIANGGGVVYAPLGPTHEATDDIAILRSIPGMTIIAPADANEMLQVIPQTVDVNGPVYIRVAKGYDPIVTDENMSFQLGKPTLARAGSDSLIITTGITLGFAREAADILCDCGHQVKIMHLPTIKPLDKKILLESMINIPIIVTVEEHSLIGGLGSAIAEIIAESSLSSKPVFERIGIPDEFPDQYGSQKTILENYGISGKGIVNKILTLAKSVA